MNNSDAKNLPAILSYLWLPGWLAGWAIFSLKKDYKTSFNKFHLFQSLTIHLSWLIITLIDLYLEDYTTHGQAIIWISWLILIWLSIDGFIGALRNKWQKVFFFGWLVEKLFNFQSNEAANN